MAPLSESLKEAIRADLRRTHGTTDGATRRVANRNGVSQTTVRRIADAMGLDGAEARTKTKNATEALRQDWAKRRAEIAELALNEAHQSILDMRRPAVIYNFGGKDNTYNEKTVDSPPTGDRRNLAIIAGTLLDKHKMLDQYDAQQGLASAVDDWLIDRLGKGDGS